VLLGWFLWPFLAHGFSFPLGPDAPVYLWWTRLAGQEGLSAVGHRAGAPALAVVLQGTLGVSVVQAVAALEVVLGGTVGLAAAALLRGRTSTAGWALGGLLAGTFAVHLVAGYVANLVQVATFLAALVALAEATRRGAWLAGAMLGAGALAHPLFFGVALAILAVATATAWRGDRDDAVRIAGAVALGAGLAAAGLLALLVGPAAPDVDTSRDAFLRRAGLTGELRGAYLDRFVHRWARYVQWASLPLAVAGVTRSAGTAGRLLRAWLAVLVGGLAFALVTGWIPADRFVTFGFAVPILAALGLARLLETQATPRVVAWLAAAALTVAMLAGAFIAWDRQEPFLSEAEVSAATRASFLIGELPPRTPLAFLVNEADASVSFTATRAANVIRAALPPDRARDLVVLVPPLEGAPSSEERRALERLTAQDLAAAERRTGREAVVFVLRPFDAIDSTVDGQVVDGGPVKDRFPIAPLAASSAAAIALASVGTLALFALAGYGWARAVLRDRLRAAAVAPAIGAAALVLVAVALERVGVPLDAAAGAWIVSALAGGSGCLAWRILERRLRADPSP
jgi:hypothetical protein